MRSSPVIACLVTYKPLFALIAGPAEQPVAPRICPGAPKRQKDEAHALQQLARRIRTFPEGKYAPSPPPNVLGKLTDALIVTASDIVISVAQEEPALSGNSTFRLLAWTVADARGAQTAIEKPLALTVGKRVQVQATRMRNDAAPYCKPIIERASREREKLRDGPMTSGDGEAALEAALAATRAKELSELQQAKETEIYTGFDELESLLTEEQRWDDASIEQRVAWSLVDARAAELAADVPAPAIPASSTGPPDDFDPEVAIKAHFAECGIIFPWVLSQERRGAGGYLHPSGPPQAARRRGLASFIRHFVTGRFCWRAVVVDRASGLCAEARGRSEFARGGTAGYAR